MKSVTYLHLSKQNFKFSSGHFLIFDETRAEMLHGHNYQVKVDILKLQESAGQKGYLIDFYDLKKIIKQLCDVWDEHVLLPENHPDMKKSMTRNGKNCDISFRDRFYSFPKDEVIWLPVENTSVESLSGLFAKTLMNELKKMGVLKLKVSIEETRGQSASTTVSI
jgi:6-pyruvoyltetrahydropterin/6-carboxytetrahydropterin synthase